MHLNEPPLPRTVAGAFDVVGPRVGPEDRHIELARRTSQWHVRDDNEPGGEDEVLPTEQAVGQATGLLLRSALDMAAVVHSRTGRTHFVRVPGTGRPRWTGIRSLVDVPVAAVHRTGIGADTVARLTQPFSGLFPPPIISGVGGDPVIARLSIPGSASRAGRGWAADPETAAERALLSGVRALATRLAPAQSGPLLVGAAGASELHFLLDGALRLLSGYAVGPADHDTVDDALEVAVYHVPYLSADWRIARVFRTSCGGPVAAAWGRGGPDAIRHAVTAARVHLAVPDHDPDAHSPTADAMLYELAPAELSRLRHDVHRCADRLRFRPLGMRLAADAVLGDTGLAWGVVWPARRSDDDVSVVWPA